MIRNLVFIALFLTVNCMYGQVQQYNQRQEFLKANSVWAFGNKAGLNFNSGSPVAVLTAGNTYEASISVADPVTGELLFYYAANSTAPQADMKMWNRNHQIMPNGNGIHSSSSCSQVSVVPVIGQPGKYYVFIIAPQTPTLPSRLNYCLVDMALDNGLGDIVPGQKNVLLTLGPLSEAVMAVPGNNCDIWLLTHKYLSEFVVYHIDSAGIGQPVVNPGNSIYASECGAMAVSPNRERVWMSSSQGSGIGPSTLYKFNPSTGVISEGITIPDVFSYTAAFSPDNSKLYLAGHQFDISVHNPNFINASKVEISGFSNFSSYVGLRLYKDTIYVFRASPSVSTYSLSTINQPNLDGVACEFQAASISLLPGTNTRLGLGFDVVYSLPPDTSGRKVLDTTLCTIKQNGLLSLASTFELNASPGYWDYEWENGSSGISRTITAPGTYWALCKDNCHSWIDTFVVRPNDLSFSLGSDTIVCDQAVLDIQVPISSATYRWQDGSAGRSYRVTATGIYWAIVQKDGCTARDSISIEYRDLLRQDLGSDITFCKGESIQVPLSANIPSGSFAIWNTGSQNNTINAEDSGTYWLTVVDPPCFGTDTIRISVEICSCFVQVPSAFTPNSDGINDQFFPLIDFECPVNGYLLNIFNRFGQRVFTSVDREKGWNGNYNGFPVDVGSYFFELSFYGAKHKHFYHKGDIALLR